MTEHDAFAERGRSIEEEYFRRKDRELVERLRQADAAGHARDEMGQRTGLHDPAMLQDLQELGFTPDTVGLLPLVPVLEVAWAEGGITAAERALVVALARSRGIADGSAADRQLTEWLAVRPEPAVFTRAGRLIAALLTSDAPATLGLKAGDLVAYCERIAAASGGFLGLRLGSVSPEERSLLARIASDLETRQR